MGRERLAHLSRCFSLELVQTAARDLEPLAWFYFERAYELGLEQGGDRDHDDEGSETRPPDQDERQSSDRG
jgi:hypothetical protein